VLTAVGGLVIVTDPIKFDIEKRVYRSGWRVVGLEIRESDRTIVVINDPGTGIALRKGWH
jgi:hypothetical protein